MATLRKLDGEQVLMRVFIGEGDRQGGKPLYRVLVERMRAEGLAGATALRGVLGFGARSHMHDASILRLSQDLPIVIETVDTQEHIDAFLPILDEMMPDGLVTLERARVIRYGVRD